MLASSLCIAFLVAVSSSLAAADQDYSTSPVTISYKVVPRAHGTSAFLLQKPVSKAKDPSDLCLNALRSELQGSFQVYKGKFNSDMPSTSGVRLTAVTFSANITNANHEIISCRVESTQEQFRASYEIISSAHGTVSFIPFASETHSYTPSDEKHICLSALAQGFGSNSLDCDVYGKIGMPFRYCHPSLEKGNFTFIAQVTMDASKQRNVTACEAQWWN